MRPSARAAPTAVLTGDALFVGDVGRPDVAASVGSDPVELARAQYRTLRDVFARLPGDVGVHPGHGAGSACGRSLSAEPSSTIAAELASNWALQPMSEDRFVAEILTGQPPVPAYFADDAVLNRIDHARWRPQAAHRPTPRRARRLLDAGVPVIDARTPDAFAAAHLAGSLNIGIDGRFAETAGMFVRLAERVLLLAPAGRGEEAVMRLARIGIDRVAGVVEDVDGLLGALPDRVASAERYDVAAFDAARREDAVIVLDVRAAAETARGAVPGAVQIPLPELDRRVGELPHGAAVAVHCAAGWRSSVAASALRAAGIRATDLRGGYAAWSAAARATA